MSCRATSCELPLPSIETSDRAQALPRLRISSPAALLRMLGRWHERWVQRQCLRELDDRLLNDIGVTREQARKEADKPFWM